MNAMIERAKKDSIYVLYATALTQAAEEITRLEKEIREDAVKEHEKTKDKHLVNGAVNIVDRIVLSYSIDMALDWCKKNLTPAVIPEKLDIKAFEKLAKEVKPECVKITRVPEAQIAQDLSKYDLSCKPDPIIPGTTLDDIPF